MVDALGDVYLALPILLVQYYRYCQLCVYSIFTDNSENSSPCNLYFASLLYPTAAPCVICKRGLLFSVSKPGEQAHRSDLADHESDRHPSLGTGARDCRRRWRIDIGR